MNRIALFWIALFASYGSSLFITKAAELKTIKGECAPQSHIAEGEIGEDLTKKQSRFFCDAAVISVFDDNPKHIMIQFADSKSNHGRQIGYAGMMQDKETLVVRGVYLETAKFTPVAEGYCKLFFKEGKIADIVCGAKIDEGGRRTVPVVSFNSDLTSTPAPSLSQSPNAPVPYEKSGIVNCALPGTVIDFALNGRGGASVARLESNYTPFRQAAQMTHQWRAGLVDKDGTTLLVLDNDHKTRIMISLPGGKGFAFSADGGVSEILCQVLVSP